MSDMKKLSRRTFIKRAAGAGAALAFPTIVPASVFGQNGKMAPSDRIVMACIGVGWQGTSNMESFLDLPDVQIVAVADIDKGHLADAKRIVDGKYGNHDCATYHDYREIMVQGSIDAVSLGLPDHWHAIPAIAAAKAGKDVFGEKPFSHSLREGRAMIDALNRYQRVWQTGSWQRSQANFRFACELVRNGRIGKVHTVEVGLPEGHNDFANTKDLRDFTTPPPELDYDTWLGPAPEAPYAVARVHKNWRWNYDYGGGQLLDWIGHHGDIAHWGLDLENTGPVEVTCQGDIGQNDVIWNTAKRYRGVAKYRNGIEMVLGGGYSDIADGRGGTKWIGDLGWVWVSRGGSIDAEPKRLLREVFGAGEVHLFQSPGHWRNFIDCVKDRSLPIAPAEVAHRSASIGHVALISMKLGGRTLRFDPDKEVFRDDAEANRLLSRPYRAPWHLG
jgi:predicted dehydrogenase